MIGGTGTTGRRVAAQLHRRGVQMRIATRHPGSVPPDAVGTAVVFDWNEPESYPAAVAGAERVYLLRPPGVGSDALGKVERFLAEADHAGVRRVVLLHSTATGPASMPEIADLVERSMPEWAVICPSWFMQNLTGDHPTARAIRRDGEIATATGAGRVGFIDADDIAATATELLLAAGPPNARFTLTGPDALSYPQVAAIISEACGRPVRHLDLSPDELAKRWVAAGLPEPLARLAADADLAIREGGQDFTTSTVEEVCGRPPRSLRDFAHAHRDAWSAERRYPVKSEA
ncbi:MAG TPA: NAD(P)H-binding protein [Actinocrinis sp.]